MIKSIGIRAHDFGKMTSANLAKSVKSYQLGSVQLALNKAIIGIDEIDDPMTDHGLTLIGKDFHEAGIDVAVLGCYLNYAHPNKAERMRYLDIFRRHINYGFRLGAGMIGTETGSLMEDYSFCKANHSDEAYKIFASSLYQLLDVAESQGIDIGIEGVWDHIIYNNDRMSQLIKDMKSSRLKVILDPVNLLNYENYVCHDDIVKEAFDLFGQQIQVVHAKDYRVEGNRIIEVSHGQGLYDYKYLSKLIAASPEAIDILLENAVIDDLPGTLKLFELEK